MGEIIKQFILAFLGIAIGLILVYGIARVVSLAVMTTISQFINQRNKEVNDGIQGPDKTDDRRPDQKVSGDG